MKWWEGNQKSWKESFTCMLKTIAEFDRRNVPTKDKRHPKRHFFCFFCFFFFLFFQSFNNILHRRQQNRGFIGIVSSNFFILFFGFYFLDFVFCFIFCFLSIFCLKKQNENKIKNKIKIKIKEVIFVSFQIEFNSNFFQLFIFSYTLGSIKQSIVDFVLGIETKAKEDIAGYC